METCLKLSLFLCVLGFLKEIRPSENFYFEYLTGKWWNCSREQLLQEVMPISTYSQVVWSVVVFLATDLLRYKPFIIILAFAGAIAWSLWAWGSTILQLQVSMVFYGLFYATETAYFTYIYAKVPKEYYVQVTSHTRAALILGHGVSGVISQSLVGFKLLDYQQLNYVTVSSMVIVLIWAILLPSVSTSIYFHVQSDIQNTTIARFKNAFKLMKHHFTASYSQWYVIKWSVWWSLSMCGFIHVQLYIQPLWSLIAAETNAQLYNGVAETVMTVVGFLATISVGVLKIDWHKYGDFALCSSSGLSAIFIIISSQASNIFISYAVYVGFGGVFYFVITIATSEVAKCILEDSYGLVFGLNGSIAWVLQTILLLVFVTGDIGWALNPREQHLAYGVCHAGIAVLFTAVAITTFIKRIKNVV